MKCANVGTREVAVRVKDLVTRSVAPISSEDTVTEGAKPVDRRRIYSTLIGDGKEFAGVITVLDLTNRIVSIDLNPGRVKIWVTKIACGKR
jgi:predicted transcriptional regulator